MEWAADVGFVANVAGWYLVDVDETMGARDKVWVDPEPDAASGCALLKRPRQKGLPESGSDLWAEVLAAAIARLVLVPRADVAFAVDGELRHCVLSRRIQGQLVFGNELLSAASPDYPTLRTEPVHYNLDAIQRCLHDYAGSEPGLNAFESFAGYLVFDALIANTDRHHENWAVITESRSLAPTYDHGASLGFNASPQQRLDPEGFALRGRSGPFGTGLLELARQALDRVPSGCRDLWLDRVASLKRDDLDSLVAAVPSGWMSVAARTFVVNVVMINRERLLS